uniref:hypothetical protein n=1 Tax=Lentilactobacillus hilgardii TaxID=1588 RepID=UPI00403FBC1C
MLKTIMINIATVLGFLIGVPFLFIFLLAMINQNTKAVIAKRFGINGQLIFGFLGVIIHEASHLIVALVFGHKIKTVRLIRRPTIDNPSLGYVNHTWQARNLYQTIGNLFIGVAPVFGCCTTILFLARWLLPNIYNWLVILTYQPLSITAVPAFQWGSMLLFILLTANICIGGFDLSLSDYRNSIQGLATTILLLIGLTIVLSLIPIGTTVFATLYQAIKVITVISTFNLLISAVLNLVFKLI